MKFRIVWVLALALVMLIVSPAAAFAQDGGDVVAKDLVFLDETLLARLQGLVIPLITALVMTKMSTSLAKSVCTALLSVLAGSVAVWIEHAGAANLSDFANSSLDAFITAIGIYYGLLKPTGIAPKIQTATANFGIGRRAA